MNTLNSKLSDAALCRANGWTVGTKLHGVEYWPDESSHVAEITVTAIGERCILAKRDNNGESIWMLMYREWKAIDMDGSQYPKDEEKG